MRSPIWRYVLMPWRPGHSTRPTAIASIELDIEHALLGRRPMADDWPPVYTSWRARDGGLGRNPPEPTGSIDPSYNERRRSLSPPRKRAEGTKACDPRVGAISPSSKFTNGGALAGRLFSP